MASRITFIIVKPVMIGCCGSARATNPVLVEVKRDTDLKEGLQRKTHSDGSLRDWGLARRGTGAVYSRERIQLVQRPGALPELPVTLQEVG